jgi:hypothetical protein
LGLGLGRVLIKAMGISACIGVGIDVR